MKVKVARSCLILCNPMDCSLPGSSVHGILQARILEWVAIPFSREASPPRSPALQVDSLLSQLPAKPGEEEEVGYQIIKEDHMEEAV